jgi:hypothetical protein
VTWAQFFRDGARLFWRQVSSFFIGGATLLAFLAFAVGCVYVNAWFLSIHPAAFAVFVLFELYLAACLAASTGE